MSVTTTVPEDQAEIVMSRIYDAPRDVVWRAMTDPRHVARWWGGPGFTNPVCEMDVRPGGAWHHVMRFPDGHELDMHFVFVEVEKPWRLVWRSPAPSKSSPGRPDAVIDVTLEDLGGTRTRWKMVARFSSAAERDAALAMGFAGPIEASGDRLVAYLPDLVRQGDSR